MKIERKIGKTKREEFKIVNVRNKHQIYNFPWEQQKEVRILRDYQEPNYLKVYNKFLNSLKGLLRKI